MTLATSLAELTGHFVNHGQVEHIARLFAVDREGGNAGVVVDLDFVHDGSSIKETVLMIA